jgi:hypothetical protein
LTNSGLTFATTSSRIKRYVCDRFCDPMTNALEQCYGYEAAGSCSAGSRHRTLEVISKLVSQINNHTPHTQDLCANTNADVLDVLHSIAK